MTKQKPLAQGFFTLKSRRFYELKSTQDPAKLYASLVALGVKEITPVYIMEVEPE